MNQESRTPQWARKAQRCPRVPSDPKDQRRRSVPWDQTRRERPPNPWGQASQSRPLAQWVPCCRPHLRVREARDRSPWRSGLFRLGAPLIFGGAPLKTFLDGATSVVQLGPVEPVGAERRLIA